MEGIDTGCLQYLNDKKGTSDRGHKDSCDSSEGVSVAGMRDTVTMTIVTGYLHESKLIWRVAKLKKINVDYTRRHVGDP